MVKGAALDAREYPPVTYLVDKLVTAGSVTLLAGAPKVGKSFLALGLACAVASGGRALSALAVNNPGDVLVVSLDDTSHARAQRRLRAVAYGPIPPRVSLYTGHELGRGVTAADNLCRYLDEHPTRLVVIDTLEHFRPQGLAGDSAYSADTRFLATLRLVPERTGVTVLPLTHTRKVDARGDGDDPITAVSGTHGVTGGADAVLTLTGTRGAPDRVLHVVSRDDDDVRLVLTWSAHGLHVSNGDPDDPTVRMTAQQAKVYRALRDMGVPAGATDLAPACPGVPKLGNVLLQLAKLGWATQQGRGTYVVA